MSAPPASRHLGIDLGATNLKWSVLERTGDGWRSVARDQVRTRAEAGPEAVVERMVAVGRAALAEDPGIESVGVGVPGLYDPAHGTTRVLVNMPGDWADRPLAVPLAAALGRPVRLVNDARAFGLAELRLGAARGASSMVGLTLGTGVGGVIAIGGEVVHGHDGTAGEIGHQTIDPNGPWCNCGNRGCLEAYARADQIAIACGAPTAAAGIEAARGGDERACRGLADVGRYLGIGIANLITLIVPDRVVIGGGIAAAGPLLLDPIRAELERRVPITALQHAELVTAELGVWAGAIGAALHGAEGVAAGEFAARSAAR